MRKELMSYILVKLSCEICLLITDKKVILHFKLETSPVTIFEVHISISFILYYSFNKYFFKYTKLRVYR